MTSLTNARVEFDWPAKLYVIPRTGKIFERGGAVYGGTLAGAVAHFLELDGEYGSASIGFDVGAIEGETTGLIGENEIRELARHPSFRK